MEITLLGIKEPLHPIINVLEDVSIMALHLSRESYLGFPSSTINEFRPLQPAKAELPMEVTLLGIVIELRLVQPWKELAPKFFTLLPMITDAKLVQSIKALSSIEVTLFGITTEVRVLQLRKAPFPIEVTLLGMIVFLQPSISVLDDLSMMTLQFSGDS